MIILYDFDDSVRIFTVSDTSTAMGEICTIQTKACGEDAPIVTVVSMGDSYSFGEGIEPSRRSKSMLCIDKSFYISYNYYSVSDFTFMWPICRK